MKEIGGYYELERFDKEEYHKGLLALNLGRTALIYAMRKNKADKIYLPYFLCHSVKAVCQREGWKIRLYHIDRDFHPIDLSPLQAGEYLYLVNYYGQLNDERILDFKDKYGRVIVDHVHDFFRRPLKGVISIYSCRKFFGLSDGAYLSMDGIGEDKSLPPDFSAQRMGHVLGRLEKDGASYYQAMLDNAAGYDLEEVKRMSGLTKNLLCGINYERVKSKRRRNYEILDTYLKEMNQKDFYKPSGPMAYPFYTEGGGELRRLLSKEKIYVPTYWTNVFSDRGVSKEEIDMAENILPLPCDHRYDEEDMLRLVNTLLACKESLP